MKNYHLLLISLCLLLSSMACQAQKQGKSPYSYKSASYDGIGKVYLGREISFIMGFHGKDWLERHTRELEEGVSLAIENLPISEESIVADIGAASGYYTFRMAPLVPQGKVYAVEIQKEAIQYLAEESARLGFDNVIPIMGSDKTPNLPESSIDLALMVDVYHELEYPEEMLKAIWHALKPDGKLLLIEYRGEDPSVPIKPLHKMTIKQARRELEANGFELTEIGHFMPMQHFLVFSKDALWH